MTPSSLESRAERQVYAADSRDEELANMYGSGERARASVDHPPAKEPEPPLSERLAALMTPWTVEELEAARIPHPHVFQLGERGMFPLREVSIVGARGREGKTTVLTAVATACATGHTLAELPALSGRALIYSAEDDRAQYARKVGAQMQAVSRDQVKLLRDRILVPDLDAPSVAEARQLVMVLDRQPMVAGAVEAIIEACRPLTECEAPLRLMVFETASTLSDADEDNRGHKILVGGLKRIARALNVAVVLVHHTSQAADANLADLNISTADIRGATGLVYNARQAWMMVNLGSESDPFPENDARTVLREMVLDGEGGAADDRISALICLDSSKSINPPPVFFRWLETDSGPAAVEINAPARLAGKPWRKVHEMVRAERLEARAEAKQASKRESNREQIELVVRHATQLHAAGRAPTASAVSVAAGKSKSWAGPYLAQAVEAGYLVCKEESVPRTSGLTTVFRPNPEFRQFQQNQ